MAVYQSAGRRRRNAVLLLVVGLVVGVLAGLLAGRATAPTVSDKVHDSRAQGSDVVALLQSLPFEYEQTRAGAAGKSDATFAASIDQARHRLDSAIDATPWFGSRTINELQVSIDRLRADARSHVDQAKFSADVDRSVDLVSKAFGIKVTPTTSSP